MIHLRQIRLQNFRRFIDETIKFENGVMGIVGNNGTGKSTIVEAVGYAFYGSQPALTRTGKDDMKRSDAPEGESWGVVLDFNVGETQYSLTRRTKGAFDKFKAEVKLYRNGSLLATGDTPVRKEIRNIIGMEYQAFASSVFCRQAEVATLSGLQPAERKRLILRMLGIAGIDDAVKSLRTTKRDLERSLKTLDGVIGDESVTDLEGRKKMLMEQLSRLREDIMKVEAKKSRSDRNLKNAGSLRSGLLKERAELDKRRKEQENLRVAGQRVQIVAEAIADLERQVTETKAQTVAVDDVLLSRKQEFDDRYKDIDRMEVGVRHDISNLEARIEQLKGLEAKCPTCEQDINDDYAQGLLRGFEGELNEKREHITRLKEQQKQLGEDYEEYAKEKKKADENQRYEIRLKQLESSLKNRYYEQDNLPKTNFDQKVYDDLEVKIQDLDGKMNIGDSESSKWQKGLAEANDELQRIKADIASNEGQIKEIDKRMKHIEETEEKAQGLTLKVAKYKMTDDVLNEFRVYLIGKVRPMLSLFTSQLISQMTNGRYVKVDIDENYDIAMFDRGVPYPLQRFSGGEQAVVNLALRLALSQMIAVQRGTEGLGFIILDEVFGSADTERRETIMTTLNGLQNTYSQIICITHIDTVRDMLPSTIRVTATGPSSVVL